MADIVLGMVHASEVGMGVRRVEELIAFQLAVQFKLAVYGLVQAHPEAAADVRYRSQLFEAAASGEANVAEGFDRYGAREFRRFLSYARSSIAEARRRLVDGAHRRHFDEAAISEALILANRAIGAIAALRRSLAPFVDQGSRPNSR